MRVRVRVEVRVKVRVEVRVEVRVAVRVEVRVRVRVQMRVQVQGKRMGTVRCIGQGAIEIRGVGRHRHDVGGIDRKTGKI